MSLDIEHADTISAGSGYSTTSQAMRAVRSRIPPPIYGMTVGHRVCIRRLNRALDDAARRSIFHLSSGLSGEERSRYNSGCLHSFTIAMESGDRTTAWIFPILS